MTTESFKQILQSALKDWRDESWKAEGAMLALNQVLHRVEIEEKWQNEDKQKLPAQEEQDEQEEKAEYHYSDTPPISEPTDKYCRPRERLLIVDGEHHHFKNGQDMLGYFNLMKYYGKFMHLFQRKGGRENLVEYEANALRELLWEKWQIHLDSYTAHGFDGLAKTIMFEKEEEKENA